MPQKPVSLLTLISVSLIAMYASFDLAVLHIIPGWSLFLVVGAVTIWSGYHIEQNTRIINRMTDREIMVNFNA